MMAEKNDTTSRITVYRLAKKQDLVSASVPDYEMVASDTEATTGFEYTLWFSQFGAYTPNWYAAFKGVTKKTPKAKQSGFVLLVNTSGATYACTGGLGYHALLDGFDIEPRFGITLAKKIIGIANLKGLVQKDASGIVNSLDRVFRGIYNPQGDIDNLHRVLTNLRASFQKDNPKYAAIGASIRAGDSLAANGAKDFSGILTFVKEVDQLWRSKKKGLAFPELEHINPKHSAGLIDRLNKALVDEIAKFQEDGAETDSPDLFLDNISVGYLPDRVVEYSVSYKRDTSRWPTYQDVFAKMAEVIAEAEPTSVSRFDVVKSFKLRLTFDDDSTSRPKPLLQYICGDVVLDNEAYFISNGLWYKANEDFIKKINAELDEVLYQPPGEFGLRAWAANEDEDSYNNKHAGKGLVVLDRHLVRVKQERGPVEFCDLLDSTDTKNIYMIHVKKASGAELRALFAQGYVSAQLYSESDEFRDNVHAAKIDRGSSLSKKDKRALAALKDKPRRSFSVVYAIFDDSSAHAPKKASAARVGDVLTGTLTLFAKIDLLFRVQGIRALGYNVALTRIKPYPRKS